MSISTYQTDDQESIRSEEMEYRQLSFEDDLFTARVYKRNYRNPLLLRLLNAKPRSHSGTTQLVNGRDQGGQQLRHQGQHKSMEGKRPENVIKPTKDGLGHLEGDLTLRNTPAEETRSALGPEISPSMREKDPLKERAVPSFLLLSPRTDQYDSILDFHDVGPQSFQQNIFEVKSVQRAAGLSPLKEQQYKPSIQAATEGIETSSTKLLGYSSEIFGTSHQDGDNGAAFNPRLAPSLMFEERQRAVSPSADSDTRFMDACEKGDYQTVKTFLEWGHDVHSQRAYSNKPGFGAIHAAAMYGQVDIVETLLLYGFSLEDKTTSIGSRPLHIAAQSGNVPMVQLLMGHGAEISAENHLGEQPIHLAAKSGLIEVLTILIEGGAVLDYSDSGGRQPLHCAAESSDQPSVIDFLVGMGADLNARRTNISKERPLDIACRRGLLENIRILLELGAEVNGSCKYGSLPAFEALMKGGNGSPPQIPVTGTVLHILMSALPQEIEKLEVITKLLFEHGVDVDAQDENGDTVLHLIAGQTSSSLCTRHLAKVLLVHGVNLDIINKAGFTPLYLASNGYESEIFKLLIRFGARTLFRTGKTVLGLEYHAAKANANENVAPEMCLENSEEYSERFQYDLDLLDPICNNFSILGLFCNAANRGISHGSIEATKQGLLESDSSDSSLQNQVVSKDFSTANTTIPSSVALTTLAPLLQPSTGWNHGSDSPTRAAEDSSDLSLEAETINLDDFLRRVPNQSVNVCLESAPVAEDGSRRIQESILGGPIVTKASQSPGSLGLNSFIMSKHHELLIDEVLLQNFLFLKDFLSQPLRENTSSPRSIRGRDKILRLGEVKLIQLSTDTCDELRRRRAFDRQTNEQDQLPTYLLPNPSFCAKRNQARRTLATLPPPNYQDLATDVFHEIKRRLPYLL